MSPLKQSETKLEQLKFIDLFSGIGGFRIALENVGLKCVFSCEVNPKCQSVYSHNFGEQPFSDLTEVEPNNVPNFDILTAGFPCQPFSISGKRKGFEDARGTLVFNVFKIFIY